MVVEREERGHRNGQLSVDDGDIRDTENPPRSAVSGSAFVLSKSLHATVIHSPSLSLSSSTASKFLSISQN